MQFQNLEIFLFQITIRNYNYALLSDILQNCQLLSVFNRLYACSMFFSYFIQSQKFFWQLFLRSLIQFDLKSQFIVSSQLGPAFSQDPLLVLNYRWSTHSPTEGLCTEGLQTNQWTGFYMTETSIMKELNEYTEKCIQDPTKPGT